MKSVAKYYRRENQKPGMQTEEEKKSANIGHVVNVWEAKFTRPLV